jgi:hypothetical protein
MHHIRMRLELFSRETPDTLSRRAALAVSRDSAGKSGLKEVGSGQYDQASRHGDWTDKLLGLIASHPWCLLDTWSRKQESRKNG